LSGSYSDLGRLGAAVAAVLLQVGACSSQEAAAPTDLPAPIGLDGPGRFEVEMVLDDTVRRFVVWVPETVRDPAPLVLVFHGFSSDPETVEALSEMHEVGETQGFVVVYPAASGRPSRWRVDARIQGDADVEFVRSLVGAVGSSLPIDTDRIYAAGMSNGGGMAGRLACDAADLIAAVGSVSGAHNEVRCEPTRPVAVAELHGTSDLVVPFEGWPGLLPAADEWATDWAARNGCSSEPQVRTVADDVLLTTWADCREGADVDLYRIDGGKHGWPGSDRAASGGDSTTSIDASEILWEFFEMHPMP
jgi:polyhydroxybutyrate depolymerase